VVEPPVRPGGVPVDSAESRVAPIEQAEVSGSIRLDTLERAARALDCRLVYALVPYNPLDDIVRAQARRKAIRHLAEVAHNMRLEDQAVTETDLAEQIDELASRLVGRRGLWTEDAPAGA
jgi:predicted DNA-binding mobile mystery protein A